MGLRQEQVTFFVVYDPCVMPYTKTRETLKHRGLHRSGGIVIALLEGA